MIHLQIKTLGDFRPEFMSRVCLSCFGIELVRTNTIQVHPSWADDYSSCCALMGEDTSRGQEWEGPIRARDRLHDQYSE